MDEYSQKVFDFLDKMPLHKAFTVENMCKPETRLRFVETVKLYIATREWGGGVSFFSEAFDRFHKIEIPEEAIIKNNKHGKE